MSTDDLKKQIQSAETRLQQTAKKNLEDRVARIEKWIDFWETVETPWESRSSKTASALRDDGAPRHSATRRPNRADLYILAELLFANMYFAADKYIGGATWTAIAIITWYANKLDLEQAKG